MNFARKIMVARWRISLLISATLLFCSPPAALLSQSARTSRRTPTRKTSPVSGRSKSYASSLQTARNLGVAFYEQGKYPEAEEQFRKIIAAGHATALDHVNLALALMQNNKMDAALGELTTAQQLDPKLTSVDYNLGILYKRELRYTDSEAAFKRVVTTDPGEPSAWFNLGTVRFAERQFPEALDAYEHVNKIGFGRGQNFYVASLFRTYTVLNRMGRHDEAQKILTVHSRFKDKVPTISLQNQALEGGKYGTVQLPSVPPALVIASTPKVTFSDTTSKLGATFAATKLPSPDAARMIKASDYSLEFARKNLVPLFGSSVAFGDYDSDGREDMYVVNPSGGNHLFHNNGDGTFTDVTEKAGVAGPAGSVAASFADYNNSGHPSLFVAGLGGVTLFSNKGDGTFIDETEKAGLPRHPGELDTRAVLFDADADGFLDLVVTAYSNLGKPPAKETFAFPRDFSGAQSHFNRNNGNGTFSDVTESAGLSDARGRMRGMVFGEFTSSGYPDLLFFRDDAPPLLFENQGEDKFENRTREAEQSLSQEIVFDAQVADFNHDGKFDLLLWTSAGPELLSGRGAAKFGAAEKLAEFAPPDSPFAFRGTNVDLDGDGFDDVLALDGAGKWHFLANRAGHFQEGQIALPIEQTGDRGHWTDVAPAWLSTPGRLGLIALSDGGKFAALEKDGQSSHWLQIRLKGFKSNTDGIGTIVEFKSGNFYNKVEMTGSIAGIYTDGLSKLDVVRVTWPNQVIQNSVDVKADTTLGVSESERLASSCPLLYIWNGEKYVFVTDMLGTGPLGELAPDGTYIKPNSREFVRLPEYLRPKDGFYSVQITDELREVDFVDRLRLMAIDHAPGENIYANEIYSSMPVTPELYAVRNERAPVSAVDDHGNDVLDLLRAVDRRYPADFKRDRILGMAETHSLTLDLGDFPDSSPASLWLTGWVFWTDSNGSRAMMFNPQLPMISPYIQVKDKDGKWVTVIPDMGLPSGTNRTMRVSLEGKFLSSDHHVRIVTNLCIYWDRIFFTTDESKVQPSQALAPLSADLHYRGFSEPATDPNHLVPDFYEYASLMKMAPWNPMTGNYTRYGNVLPLLSDADDHLVVLATGDEMTVNFNAGNLPPVKAGLKRDFFLDASGYAKDGEPNTAYSQTVEPMPFRAMENYPPTQKDRRPTDADYKKYLDEFQNRKAYKLIPPLAPPAQ